MLRKGKAKVNTPKFAALRASPATLATLDGKFSPPLYARMLYGGITEEVLLRWGLMTGFA